MNSQKKKTKLSNTDKSEDDDSDETKAKVASEEEAKSDDKDKSATVEANEPKEVKVEKVADEGVKRNTDVVADTTTLDPEKEAMKAAEETTDEASEKTKGGAPNASGIQGGSGKSQDDASKGGQQMFKEDDLDVDKIDTSAMKPLVTAEPFSGFVEVEEGLVTHAALQHIVVSDGVATMVVDHSGGSVPRPTFNKMGYGGVDTYLLYSDPNALKLYSTISKVMQKDPGLVALFRGAMCVASFAEATLDLRSINYDSKYTPANGNGNRWKDMFPGPASRELSWIDIAETLSEEQYALLRESPCLTNVAYAKMTDPSVPVPNVPVAALDQQVVSNMPLVRGANRKYKGDVTQGENYMRKWALGGKLNVFRMMATMHPDAMASMDANLTRTLRPNLPAALTTFSNHMDIRATENRVLVEFPQASICYAGMTGRLCEGVEVYKLGSVVSSNVGVAKSLSEVLQVTNTNEANSFNVTTKSTLSTVLPEDSLKNALMVQAGVITEQILIPDMVMMIFALITYHCITPFVQYSPETPVRMFLSFILKYIELLPDVEQAAVGSVLFAHTGLGATGTNLKRPPGATGPNVSVRSYLNDRPSYLPDLWTDIESYYRGIYEHDDIRDDTKQTVMYFLECLMPIVTHVRVVEDPSGPLYVSNEGDMSLAYQEIETGRMRGNILEAIEARTTAALNNLKRLISRQRTERRELQSAEGLMLRGVRIVDKLQLFWRVHPNALVPTVSFELGPTFNEDGPIFDGRLTFQNEWVLTAGANNPFVLERKNDNILVVDWRAYASKYFNVAGMTDLETDFVAEAQERIKASVDIGKRLIGAMTANEVLSVLPVSVPAGMVREVYKSRGFTSLADKLAEGASADQSRVLNLAWKSSDDYNPRFGNDLTAGTTQSVNLEAKLEVNPPDGVLEWMGNDIVITNKVTINGIDPHSQMQWALFDQTIDHIDGEPDWEFVMARQRGGVTSQRGINIGNLELYKANNDVVLHEINELRLDATSASMQNRVAPEGEIGTATSVVGVVLRRVNWISGDNWRLMPVEVQKAVILAVEQGYFGWIVIKGYPHTVVNQLASGNVAVRYDLDANQTKAAFCHTQYAETSIALERRAPRLYCLAKPVGTPLNSIGNFYSFPNVDNDAEIVSSLGRPAEAADYIHVELPFPLDVLADGRSEKRLNSQPIACSFVVSNGLTKIEKVRVDEPMLLEYRGYSYP